jgi:hypothetical protein
LQRMQAMISSYTPQGSFILNTRAFLIYQRGRLEETGAGHQLLIVTVVI